VDPRRWTCQLHRRRHGWAMVLRASPTPSLLVLHHGRREVHDAFAAAGAAGDEDASTWVFDVHKVPPPTRRCS
jgi:hypothetical protein